MKKIFVSVVVPTHNREDLLEKNLNSLLSQTYPSESYECIVIDDSSTDGTEATVRRIIENTARNLSYIKQEKKGPAAARNLGIRRSRGEVIGLLDDDIIVEDDWIEKGVSILSSENVDVIAGPARLPQELGGNLITDYLDIYENRETSETSPYYLRTWNFFAKKNIFDDIGLFDEDFKFSAGEDVEWGQRAIFNGKKLFYTPKLVAYHFHLSSITDLFKRGYKYGTQEPKWINKTKFLRSRVFQARRMLRRICWFIFPFMVVATFLSYQISQPIFFVIFLATFIVFLRLGQTTFPIFIYFVERKGFLRGMAFLSIHLLEEFVIGFGFLVGWVKEKFCNKMER